MLVGANFLAILAEAFLFVAINIGVVGVVIAVVASNFVLVTIISTLLGKASLN